MIFFSSSPLPLVFDIATNSPYWFDNATLFLSHSFLIIVVIFLLHIYIYIYIYIYGSRLKHSKNGRRLYLLRMRIRCTVIKVSKIHWHFERKKKKTSYILNTFLLKLCQKIIRMSVWYRENGVEKIEVSRRWLKCEYFTERIHGYFNICGL